jgi:hypothetical protein
MSFLFGSPKAPTPAPPAAPEPTPPTPTIDQAALGQEFADKMRRRRGRRSTILVPDTLGQNAPAAPAAATVLG